MTQVMLEALLAILKDPGKVWWSYCRGGTIKALCDRRLVFLRSGTRAAFPTLMAITLVRGSLLEVARDLRQRARYEEAKLIEEEVGRWQP